jgi:uncharacterized protein (DUF1015 family)
MREKRIFIADGHHRYQTALRYRDLMREMDPGFLGDEAFNFVMMLLVDLEDPGLLVLPTHRLLKSNDLDFLTLETKLQAYFRIEHRDDVPDDRVIPLLTDLSRVDGRKIVLGAYGLRPGAITTLTLNDDVDIDGITTEEHSHHWKELDVSVMHSLIIERILCVQNVGSGDGQSIIFVRDEFDALRGVRNGDFPLAFFINPPSVAQICSIALAGDKMPQKSTYFHPKPLTGLVINPLDGRMPDSYKK